MAQDVPFKSIAIQRDLEVRLKNRIASLTVSSDTDSSSFPISRLSTGTDEGIYIRTRTDSDTSDAMGKIDGLGLTQTVYAPHIMEILTETAASTSDAIDQLTQKTLAEISKQGTKVRVVRVAGSSLDAYATAEADLDAAADSYEIRSDDIHPLTSQV
jgi:hypothetical protein